MSPNITSILKARYIFNVVTDILIADYPIYAIFPARGTNSERFLQREMFHFYVQI